jgi:hypothetical protein
LAFPLKSLRQDYERFPLPAMVFSGQIEVKTPGNRLTTAESLVMAKRSNSGPRKKSGSKPPLRAQAQQSPSGTGRKSAAGKRPGAGTGKGNAGPKQSSAYKGDPRKTVRTLPERDLEADMEAREELLEGSLAQVYSVYEEALEDGVYLPVLFLVDCEDELGGKLARDWVGREEVDEAIESNRKASKNALTTTFAQCLSFQDCQDYVPKMFDYLQGSFQQAPPEGTFIAVVVACGGAATFFVPYEGQE